MDVTRGEGTGGVYLLHLDEKMSHSQHYLGFAESSIAKRVRKHMSGKGSSFTKEAANRGIGMTLARTWEGADRSFERQLKNRKYGPKLCPICNPGAYVGKTKNFVEQVH